MMIKDVKTSTFTNKFVKNKHVLKYLLLSLNIDRIKLSKIKHL